MTSAKQVAYLVDSSIYVFRAWFTLPDTLRNDANEPVNAVYGFTDFAAGFIENSQPKNLHFAFDQSLTSSFRNTIYPPYKANRDPAPEELKVQFEYCRRFIRALGFPTLCSNRYEADDLLGAAAVRAREEGYRVTILSADKDLAQLIHEDDILWDYAKNKRYNPRQVKEHFGVRPDQIADQLAIAGDKVDNIPGVPGIGMGTAAKLLNKFDNIEQLLANIDAIADMKIRGAKRIQGLVEEHQDMILLCKKLTEIDGRAELDSPSTKNHCDLDALNELFDELGFGALRRERWQRIIAN